MTDVTRLSKLTAAVGNILDKSNLPDVSRDAARGSVRDGTSVPPVLSELVEEADGFAKNGQPLDDAWMGTAAAFLARAISDGDADSVISAQEVFRQLANTVHRSAAVAQDRYKELSHEGAVPDWSDVALAREVLAQVNALIEVADAGAGIVRPKGLAWQLEPGALPARVLLSLTQEDLVFTEDLKTQLSAGVTQLSRACNKLADRGLVTRRSHGRRAAWSLTAAGAATAQTLREAESGKPGNTPATVARSAEEFASAVNERASHIALALGIGPGDPDPDGGTNGLSTHSSCHYLLTHPISAEDIATELERFPSVILTGDDDAAYVCSDWPSAFAPERRIS